MPFQQATARAGANIALVKYWGKRHARLNLPAAGSISVTLDALYTDTTVTVDASLSGDRFVLDGVEHDPGRVGTVLELVRSLAGEQAPCRVDSTNSFPTAAGLASSASGFAALAVAAAQAHGLDLGGRKLSELARRGSGSAARSIFGGFVEMAAGCRDDGGDAVAHPLLAPEDWPLEVVVAVTDSAGKAVGSREGMNRTMRSSPYYPAWIESVPDDLDRARLAIGQRDFGALCEVAEHSALKMHASMLAARPGLIYFNAATVACLHRVRELRRAGTATFFTVDAGPQVKAVCLPGEGGRVAASLESVPGVNDVVVSGLGADAVIRS